MKTTTVARQWVMHKNPPVVPAISTSSTLPFCEWIERDLIHLERVDTAINTADHLTKALTRTLFHRHADYLLGHIPPRYSPAYETIVNTLVQTPVNEQDTNIVQYIPTSFTTPSTATANRICTPSHDDINGNPWLNLVVFTLYPLSFLDRVKGKG